MKHVVVVVTETGGMDVVLRWPCLAPIGPRLERTLPMPKTPATGYTDPRAALAAAQEFETWLSRQENGERVEVAPALPPQAKEPIEIKPLVMEKPTEETKKVLAATTPAAVHRPAAKQRDLFDDL